jgi:ribosomal protein S18 acetylase RimI-like enzyme
MTDETEKQVTDADEGIPDKNIFMICRQLNRQAMRALPAGYHLRNCREDELDIWKAMPFDDPADAEQYRGYMSDFFAQVYADQAKLFYERCLFVCDRQDRPIGTVFIWKAYDEFNTIHWLKVLKEYEGQGLGRALLSVVMDELAADDYPVYLHTQPGSYRAIKLYADFGFELLTDPIVGNRTNDIDECWPILEKYMPAADFKNLKRSQAPADFLQKLAGTTVNEF